MIRGAAGWGLFWHRVHVAAPQPLPTLLRHSHARGWILPHSTHLAPPAAWGPGCCRHPRGAAPLRAPIAEMPVGGGSCFGWGLGEAGAGCPDGGCPLQRNHPWKGLGSPTHGVTHPAPHERGRSHLQAPRMGSGGQGCGGRCRTAAAPTAVFPGPPVSGAVWGRCCLRGSTAGGRSHNPKTSPG